MAEKNKGGRPKKELDYELIEELAKIQCTQDEIASCVGVNVKTLRADEKFLDLYKKGQETGKKSLRRYQFDCAKKGNSAMLIWLGKQYLGQKDNIDVTTQKMEDDGLTTAIKESIEKLGNKDV
jgi:hypothetical protein